MHFRMDWRSVTFDWNRARAFLVTAEEGSYSAAARALGMTQPTLGRQVQALERELGIALFERVGRGLALTPSGLELVEHVRAMGEAASRVSLAATGQSQSIEGTVSITASEIDSAFLLPPMVGRLRRDHPGIRIDVVASNSVRDLRRREADIAVRSFRPTDPELIARKVMDGEARLYAAPSYVERAPDLDTPQGLSRADFIGFEDNDAYLKGLVRLGLELSERSFPLRSGSHLVHWELAKQGAGIGVMTTRVGDAEPKVRRGGAWAPAVSLQTGLAAHRELNTSRRVRLVFDRLVDEFREL